MEEGGEAWGGGEGGGKGGGEGGGGGGELWSSLAGGEACFRPSRLAVADCAAPRLFRCHSAGGAWQVDEVRRFGQADLLARHAYFLHRGGSCGFVWQGGAARPLDVR